MSNESKWGSEFGTAYSDRNNPDRSARQKIFANLLAPIINEVNSVLEVGANKGHNLEVLKNQFGYDVYGIEINKKSASKSWLPITIGSAYKLPYCDNKFGLVFTAGVLIHLDNHLKAMKEMYRVSKKYIINIEYFEDKKTVIPYRDGVLLQAMNWTKEWFDNFNNLKIVREGKMSDFNASDGTDFSKTCKYVILEKL